MTNNKEINFIEAVLGNPEAKKVLEQIEHGTSDKELEQELIDELYRISGWKYIKKI